MSDALAQSRNDLRLRLREQRTALPATTRIASATGLAGQLLPLIENQPPGYLAGYWAMDGELPLHVLVPRLPSSYIYCLPVLHADRCLRFAPWRAGDPITSNRFGIPEPVVEESSLLSAHQIRIVLLPLLGFDRHGNRLGMGGGWYDRSFAFRKQLQAPPLLVGIGYAFQEIDTGPIAEWDVPLDFVATERELIDCR
jgi:5-formyltetrahydrofolate cyclo-ligase